MLLSKMIKNAANKLDSDIARLQKSNVPLLVYGAGIGAERTKKILDNHGIKIDKIVIDDKYYQPGLSWQGYPVESLQNELSKHDTV